MLKRTNPRKLKKSSTAIFRAALTMDLLARDLADDVGVIPAKFVSSRDVVQSEE